MGTRPGLLLRRRVHVRRLLYRRHPAARRHGRPARPARRRAAAHHSPTTTKAGRIAGERCNSASCCSGPSSPWPARVRRFRPLACPRPLLRSVCPRLLLRSVCPRLLLRSVCPRLLLRSVCPRLLLRSVCPRLLLRSVCPRLLLRSVCPRLLLRWMCLPFPRRWMCLPLPRCSAFPSLPRCSTCSPAIRGGPWNGCRCATSDRRARPLWADWLAHPGGDEYWDAIDPSLAVSGDGRRRPAHRRLERPLHRGHPAQLPRPAEHPRPRQPAAANTWWWVPGHTGTSRHGRGRPGTGTPGRPAMPT